MPTLEIPNEASIRTLRNFLVSNAPFADSVPPAILRFHQRWAYMDPLALSMAAAWGGWCRREGLLVQVENMHGPHINYAARMRLFQHLGVGCDVRIEEHEEAGRFVPLTKVGNYHELEGVIADISALLHLDSEPDALQAVRYCVSELIRNVLEHSGSPEGAFVCAQRYSEKEPRRVSIAVADCGLGIGHTLGTAYAQALKSDIAALGLAMQPGISGVPRGVYGAPDNAGAGLFFTRAIATATGGYFVLLSGKAAFRAKRRKRHQTAQLQLFLNAFDDPRVNLWPLDDRWQGTVAAVEITTDNVSNFPRLFGWIRNQLPARKKTEGKIKFT